MMHMRARDGIKKAGTGNDALLKELKQLYKQKALLSRK